VSDPITIAALFESPGAPVEAAPHGSGHIHETWAVRHDGRARSLLQRLNTTVFHDPEAVMANLVRVTDHVRAKLEAKGEADAERRVLTPLRARSGGYHHRDATGGFWRCFRFVEAASSYDTPTGPLHAREAARAFGEFVAHTADLQPSELVETIPHFHHLEKRASDLEAAAQADTEGRAPSVQRELERARGWLEQLARELRKHGVARIPRRVVHNDCKINNVLMDDVTGEGLCVIDLDTVMEGTVLYDFGDLVRTASCPSPEDEVELGRMRIDPELFRSIAEGYLAGTGTLLTGEELALLPLAGPLIALETGVRFLTDHLSGDPYFRVHREGHNLDRARAQLRLVELLLQDVEPARRLITNAAHRSGRESSP
jgi:Ser/Thr protein kinase RdoA (MazF antagonist)